MCSRNSQLAFVSLLWLLLTSFNYSSAETITVQISDGEILGNQFVSSWTNKTIYSFLGIPYASPPTGDLRFKPPVPPKTWNTTKDCTQFGSTCLQPNSKPGYSEDCLFLNVYSPELVPRGALAPVYIFIHGGAFLGGSGSAQLPDKFIAEGVVVVTINYRLGALGFLTLGTSEVPGNAGMFDQILAMKWVQSEISKFGGDPNRVTIGGESAGAMSIHLHYISPASKGLFHAAIGESGSSYFVATTDRGVDYGLQLAELVNCSTGDVSLTQQCLRNLSADVIAQNQALVKTVVSESVGTMSVPWLPTVDKDTNKDNPFLPATPAELIAQGQGSAVPFLMGTNKDEGTVAFGIGVATQEKVSQFASYMRYILPSELLDVSSNTTVDEKLDNIKKKYFGGAEPSMSNLLGYMKIYGDYAFVYGTAKSAKHFSERSSVYLYRFTFDGEFRMSITEDVDKQFNTSFVGHGDELYYVFESSIFLNQTGFAPNSREMITWNKMVKLFTNFIKYQNPTPSSDSLLQNVSWTPVQNNSFHYLEISDNLTMVYSDYEGQVVQFWDDIFSTPAPSSASALLASCSLFTVLVILF